MQPFCVHLALNQSLIRAGTDLAPRAEGWSFVRVCVGNGYLMEGQSCHELKPGDLVVIPATANATVRASQLSHMRICHFGVQAGQLTGFFTADERRALEAIGDKRVGSVKVIDCNEIVARLRTDICEQRHCEPAVMVRTAMLSLAVRALRNVFLETPIRRETPFKKPEERLAALAARLPESELLQRSAKELARDCGCGERHLRRLFVHHFGAPLVQRQIQWRVEKAKQLLAETDAKIIDIAEQCGFRSLNLFNAAFKRQARMTPSVWRKSSRAAATRHQRRFPSLCPRKK